MNTMQLIIFSAMANINFPSHTGYFFQKAFELARMDLFSAEEFYRGLKMVEGEAYSDKFEEAGFEGMNFLINSGSFFVYLGIGIVEGAGRFLLSWICTKLARFRTCRRIGMHVDNPTFGATILRLFMQTYIDIFISAILQIIYFNRFGMAAAF